MRGTADEIMLAMSLLALDPEPKSIKTGRDRNYLPAPQPCAVVRCPQPFIERRTGPRDGVAGSANDGTLSVQFTVQHFANRLIGRMMAAGNDEFWKCGAAHALFKCGREWIGKRRERRRPWPTADDPQKGLQESAWL